MTCNNVPEALAVHCPNCQVEPDQPCRSSSGKVQRIVHGERLHLSYALTNPEAGLYRVEADRYRQQWPDVEAREIHVTPSAAQVRWWNRWGVPLRFDPEAFEATHGHADTSIAALPPGSPNRDDVTVSELLEKLAEATKAEAVKRLPGPKEGDHV